MRPIGLSNGRSELSNGRSHRPDMKSLPIRCGEHSSERGARGVLSNNVLVPREVECGRSPLASLARATAGRVARSRAAGDWHEAGNCNRLQKKDTGGPYWLRLVQRKQKSVRPARTVDGRDGKPHARRKGQLAEERKSQIQGQRRFSRDSAPRMAAGRGFSPIAWLAGRGLFHFRTGRDRSNPGSGFTKRLLGLNQINVWMAD